jgi:hypothetical protein
MSFDESSYERVDPQVCFLLSYARLLLSLSSEFAGTGWRKASVKLLSQQHGLCLPQCKLLMLR